MNQLGILSLLGLCLTAGCGPGSGPGATRASGKADGVGTTHGLEELVTETVTMVAPGVHRGVTTVAWYDDTAVTVESAEILLSHGGYDSVEIALDADDHVSFVVDYRRRGDDGWQRLTVGPDAARAGGTLPPRPTTLLRKLLLVPAAGEIWGEAVIPGGGWYEDTYEFGLSSVLDESVTDCRIFVTPDWDFRRWDTGESRSYELSAQPTRRQRYL